MRALPEVPGFNKRAHEEDHDEESSGVGFKQARSLMGATSQRYYYPFVVAQLLNVAGIANGSLRAVPHWVGKSTPMESLAINVNTGGPAGSIVRLGMYKGAEEYGWYPKDLVVDAGTMNTEAPNPAAEIDGLGVELEGGNWYWSCAVSQGGVGTGPDVDAFNPYFQDDIGGFTIWVNTLFSSIFGSTNQLPTQCGIFTSGITGALPDTWPLDASSGHTPDDVNMTMSYYSVLGTGNGGD